MWRWSAWPTSDASAATAAVGTVTVVLDTCLDTWTRSPGALQPAHPAVTD